MSSVRLPPRAAILACLRHGSRTRAEIFDTVAELAAWTQSTVSNAIVDAGDAGLIQSSPLEGGHHWAREYSLTWKGELALDKYDDQVTTLAEWWAV